MLPLTLPKEEVVYYRRCKWRSVTVLKVKRAVYKLEMQDLYTSGYQDFTNLKKAKEEAVKLLRNAS